MGAKINFDLKQIEDYAAHGLSIKEIAESLGVDPSTIYNRKRGSQEFQDAIKRGRARGIHAVANALFDAAINGNVTAMIFYLKSRAGWKDKPEEQAQMPVVINIIDDLKEDD